MEEQAVGGLATAAGEATAVVRGERGAGGGVDSRGKLVTTWDMRGRIEAAGGALPGIRLKVSSVSIWPAALQ